MTISEKLGPGFAQESRNGRWHPSLQHFCANSKQHFVQTVGEHPSLQHFVNEKKRVNADTECPVPGYLRRHVQDLNKN